MSMVVSTSFPIPDFDRFSRRAWGFLFGQDIQIVREEKGLSLEETARRAGMTVERWDAIEVGRVPETWQQICAMAKGLRKSRFMVASLVILYAAAWEGGPDLPGEIMQRYS